MENDTPSGETTTTSEPNPSETVVTESDDLSTEGLDFSDLDGTSSDVTDDASSEDEDHAELDDLLKDEGQQSFDRKHVEKLRKSEANTRVALKPYKEAFGQFDEDTSSRLLGLVTELGTNPEAAAQKLITLGHAVLGTEPGKTEAKTESTELDPDQPMTYRQFQEMQEKDKSKAQLQADIDQVLTDAKTLGYELGTPRAHMYLSVLANQAGGDKDAAHKMVQDYEMSVIKGYIKTKRDQRGLSTGVTSEAISTETESRKPKTFEEAGDAWLARMKSNIGK